MKTKLYALKLLAGGLLFAAVASAAYAQPVPTRKSYVTDLTGTLNARQITSLNTELKPARFSRGPEIAVLMIQSTNGEKLEAYSLRVANAWGLGSSTRNDGVLLLVAKKDRKIRMEIGKGLEKTLTDAETARIIREKIKPAFKRGDFYVGILEGVFGIRAIMRAAAAAEKKAMEARQRRSLYTFVGMFLALVLGAAVLFYLVASGRLGGGRRKKLKFKSSIKASSSGRRGGGGGGSGGGDDSGGGGGFDGGGASDDY